MFSKQKLTLKGHGYHLFFQQIFFRYLLCASHRVKPVVGSRNLFPVPRYGLCSYFSGQGYEIELPGGHLPVSLYLCHLLETVIEREKVPLCSQLNKQIIKLTGKLRSV